MATPESFIQVEMLPEPILVPAVEFERIKNEYGNITPWGVGKIYQDNQKEAKGDH